MDVNEYAQQVTPGAKSLELMLRSTQWMGAGQAPIRPQETLSHQSDFDPETGEVLDQISALAAEISSPELEPVPEPMSASPVPDAPETVDAELS